MAGMLGNGSKQWIVCWMRPFIYRSLQLDMKFPMFVDALIIFVIIAEEF